MTKNDEIDNIKVTVNIMKNKEKRKPSNIGYYQKNICRKEYIQELKLNDFVDIVSNQGAIWKSSLLLGGSKNENFKCAYFLSLDFDDGIKFNKFIEESKKIGINPTFVYETYSSTEEHNRFRVVYRLKEAIYDANLKTKLQLKLMQIFPNADKSCKDLSRLWVGGKKLIYYNPNNVIDINVLENCTTTVVFETNNIESTKKILTKSKIKSDNSSTVKMKNKQTYNVPVALLTKDQTNYPIDFDLVSENCKLYDDFISGKKIEHMEILHIANNLCIYKGFNTILEDILKKYNYNNWENKYNTFVSAVNYNYNASNCSNFCNKYAKICKAKNIRKKIQEKLLETFTNNINRKNVLEYDNYLSDSNHIINKLKELCITDGKHIINASTGSGKTYLIAKVFKELSEDHSNRLFIIACPNRVQNLQNQQSYELQALVGGEFVEFMKNNTISMVFDKSGNINDYLLENNKQLTLIIDESHQLIYANNFRKEAIKNLESLQNMANTTIHITATDRVNLYTQEYNSYTKCLSKYNTKIIDNLNIKCGSKELLEKNLIATLKYELDKNKKIAIFLDNKKEISSISTCLKATFKNKNISFLDSNEKNSTLFNSIVNCSKIPNDIDILITTSVLECGTNLNNDNLTIIYYQDSSRFFNLDKIEQSLARARKQQNNAYLFIKKTENDETEKKYIPLNYVFVNHIMDILANVRDLKETYTLLKSKTFKDNIFNDITSILESRNIQGHLLKDCVLFNEITEDFTIDIVSVIKQAVYIHDRQLLRSNHLEKLKNILANKCKATNVEILYLTDVSEVDEDKDFKEAKRIITNNKKEEKELLKQKELELKEDLKNVIDENLVYYFENLNSSDRHLVNIIKNNLSDNQKIFIDKLWNDKYKLNLILEKVKFFKKQYSKYNKYNSSYNTNYYLNLEEVLNIYITSNSKADFNNNIICSLYTLYNNQDWSKLEGVLEKLENAKQEYAIIRRYVDKTLKNKGRLSDKLVNNLYVELNPNIKKEPNNKQLDRLKQKIKAIYNVNSDGKITSLKNE